jgi:hypothetical protein
VVQSTSDLTRADSLAARIAAGGARLPRWLFGGSCRSNSGPANTGPASTGLVVDRPVKPEFLPVVEAIARIGGVLARPQSSAAGWRPTGQDRARG